MKTNISDIAENIVNKASKAGADYADAVIFGHSSVNTEYRHRQEREY